MCMGDNYVVDWPTFHGMRSVMFLFLFPSVFSARDFNGLFIFYCTFPLCRPELSTCTPLHFRATLHNTASPPAGEIANYSLENFLWFRFYHGSRDLDSTRLRLSEFGRVDHQPTTEDLRNRGGTLTRELTEEKLTFMQHQHHHVHPTVAGMTGYTQGKATCDTTEDVQEHKENTSGNLKPMDRTCRYFTSKRRSHTRVAWLLSTESRMSRHGHTSFLFSEVPQMFSTSEMAQFLLPLHPFELRLFLRILRNFYDCLAPFPSDLRYDQNSRPLFSSNVSGNSWRICLAPRNGPNAPCGRSRSRLTEFLRVLATAGSQNIRLKRWIKSDAEKLNLKDFCLLLFLLPLNSNCMHRYNRLSGTSS